MPSRKEWPVDKITVDLRHVRGDKGADKFERHIKIDGDLTDEQASAPTRDRQ